MGEITIHLCKGSSGEVVSTTVPDDIQISKLLALLDAKYAIGMGDRADQFVLYNISQHFEYDSVDTLAGRMTERGDLNILVDMARCEFKKTG